MASEYLSGEEYDVSLRHGESSHGKFRSWIRTPDGRSSKMPVISRSERDAPPSSSSLLAGRHSPLQRPHTRPSIHVANQLDWVYAPRSVYTAHDTISPLRTRYVRSPSLPSD